jgi:site-specific DNA-adenine methylase
MGGKRKLATKILNSIHETIGDFKILYDLFGGGGAVSVAGLMAGLEVHYNEINTGVANLMKYLRDGGKLPTEWITREEFHKNKYGNDWYSGFIKCVWSFGNNQRNYLFGKKQVPSWLHLEIENLKRLCHLIVTKKDENAIKEINNLFKIKLPPIQSRLELRTVFKKELQTRTDLEQLQRLEQLEQLYIYNKSYEEIEIKERSIIYCDPPHNKGRTYYQSKINYDHFYKWCLENKNPVFISEYDMPSDFKLIEQFQHTTSLAQKKQSKTIEKLYWNGKNLWD